MLIAGLWFFSSPVAAQEACLPAEVPKHATQALAATVLIQSPEGHGAGVFVNPQGRIVTAAHVVGGRDAVEVKLNAGPVLSGRVVRVDAAKDLAIIEVSGSGFRCLPFSAESRSQGAAVFAVGFPGPTDASLTRGIVSGYPSVGDQTLLQTDASLSPGYSGGPLLSEDGFIVGIVSAKIVHRSVEGVGFAVPADQVRAWLANPGPDQKVASSAGRPASDLLRQDGTRVFDADGHSLSVTEFAQRLGQTGIQQRAQAIHRRGKSAWIWGLATAAAAGGATYYGYWMVRAPPAAPQFKQAAVGTGASVAAGLAFGSVAWNHVRKRRRLDFATFYTEQGLGRLVDEYNEGGNP